jgi:hypothetical protein
MRLGWRMRYYPAVGPAIPRASVGRSRVTHPFAGHLLRDAHDLHVLSTPPAFVLSQDQTLQEKSSKQLDSERPATISASRSHRQSRQLRHRITDYCRSNSPWHPDMDARSTSPPCTSAISSISCQTAASIKLNSEPRSAAASQRTSGLQASQLDPLAFFDPPPATSHGLRRAPAGH